MVVVQHTQASKRSKLSLFRLGKSPKQPPAFDVIAASSQQGPSTRHVETNTEPQDPSAQYEFPESPDAFPSPPRVTARFSSRGYDSRQSSDSLPMDRALDLALFSQGPNNNYTSPKPILHSLSRVQSEAAAMSSHSRQRSHFSIPDVIITTCEEEGNEEVVEVRIAPNKRRSYVLKAQRGQPGAFPKGSKRYNKTASMFGRKPTPLLQFTESELGLNDAPSIPARSASPSSISSFASSTLSKSNAAQRLRKASFPNLFGRKSLDTTSNVVPQGPPTPSSAPAQSTEFQRPSMGDSAQVSRGEFAEGSTDLPSPPITPECLPTARSKKEQKAKAKEEQALVKDVERVSRLVKQHDQKTQKALEKAQAKELKRTAKLGPSRDQQGHGDAQKVAAKKTVFSATTKASSSAALGRRTSVRSTAAVRSVDPSKRDSFKFPRPAPQPKVQLVYRNVHPVAVGGPSAVSSFDNSDDIKPETITPPRPQRPVTSDLTSPTALDSEAAGNVSEDFEAHAWAPSSWSSFEPAFTGHLPSLIVTSSSSSSGSSTSSHSLPLSLVTRPSDVFSDDVAVETEDEAARRLRRASVQRVLALSDAGSNLLQKQDSLRKRHSQTQALKRRSSRLEASDSADSFGGKSGESSKRSSMKAYKRISLGRDLAQSAGWQVVAGQADSTSPLQNMDEEWEEDGQSGTEKPAHATPKREPSERSVSAETPRQRPSVPVRAATRPMASSVTSPVSSPPPRRPARRTAGPKSQSSISSTASSSSVSTTDLMNGFGLPSTAPHESRKFGVLQSNTNATNIPHVPAAREDGKTDVRLSFAPLPRLDLYNPVTSM